MNEAKLTFYKNQYPAICEVLPSVVATFQNFFNDKSHTLADGALPELEMRFGKRNSTGFSNGVSHQFLCSAVETLKQYSQWSSKTPWTQSADYFFQYGGKTVRTRVTSATDIAGNPLSTATITKNIVSRLDLFTADPVNALRLQTSWEIPVVIRALDPLTYPLQSVRIKQTCSFTYEETWRFDLSKVWSGKTANEADRLMLSGENPSSCEIEIEYVALHCSACVVRLAVSLLLKALDFFPTGVGFSLA
jgi:hypothetical protein